MRGSILFKLWAAEALVSLAMFPNAAYGQADPAPAGAATPPMPPLGLGTTTFLDAEGGPGTMFQLVTTANVASRVNDQSGTRLPGDFRQDAEVALFHVAHTTNRELLGANLGVEVLVPVAHVRVRSPGFREDTTGVGDAIVGAYLQWSGLKLFGRLFAARLDFDVVAPTGKNDRNRNINLGSKAWGVSPYLAWTWRVSDRWEISNRINYSWSDKSDAPPLATKLRDWQAGEQLAVNLSTSYGISETWRVGVSGYTLQQLSDSKADGEQITGARQRVYGVGPGVRWSHGKKMLILNVYKEFGAENRSEGYQGVLRFLTIF